MSFIIPRTAEQIEKGILKSVDSNKIITESEGRAIVPTDFYNVIKYNSAADANFTIPDDATLEIAADDAVAIEVYQMDTGVPSFVAGAGVTVNTWLGYPTSDQYVTQTIIHVGANEWAVK